MTAPPATAIVLAGGRSSRFGGDKLVAELDGRPLLAHAIAGVAPAVREIVVVLSPDGAEPLLDGATDLPIRFARDADEGRGPLAGLAAGLAAAREPLAIVVGGDQPSLVPALLVEMLRHLAPGAIVPLDAMALEEGSRIRPLPCALRVAPARSAASVALALGGGSLIRFLGRLRLGILTPDRWQAIDPHGESLRDVDHPDDMRTTGNVAHEP